MNLAELRYNEGLSPEELGEKVGVSGHTIRRLEAGHRPNPATAFKVSKHFGMKPADLWPLDDKAAA